MSHFKNTINRYGSIAISLHWLIALLILGQIFLGWYMTTFEGSSKLYGLHKGIGVLILTLVLIRIFWRTLNIAPSLNQISHIEKIAARASHYLLYFFMLAVPLSGWLMSSAAGYPVSFFGLFVLPTLISPDKSMAPLYNQVHTWFAYALLVTIGLHATAALKHHFIDKNDILRRMFFD
jgi:cytochrome b561